MTVPLMVLAVLAVVGGWVGVPPVLGEYLGGIPNSFEHWLAPVFGHAAAGAGAAAEGGAHHSAALEFALMGGSVAVALCGIALAYYLYRVRPNKPAEIAAKVPGIYDVVLNKYYIDEIYDAAVVNRIVNGSVWLWQAFDAAFLDGIVNGIAAIVRGAGDGVRRAQTGVVGSYAFSLLLGAVLIVGYLFLK